jgi:hypothetical protein
MSIKTLTKVCSVAAVLVLVFAALGPGKWIPRSGYGWQVDHFVCYFAFTLIICRAWPRAIVVGGAMTAFAVLLEGLQAFTPDRIPDLHAALYSAGGVIGAALPAHVFMRATKRLNGTVLQVKLGVSSSVRKVHTELLTAFRRDRALEGHSARAAGKSMTSIGRPIPIRLTASRLRQPL